MGFFLFALNLLFTQRGTQTMLVPLLAVCCSTWSAAVLGEGQIRTDTPQSHPPLPLWSRAMSLPYVNATVVQYD